MFLYAFVASKFEVGGLILVLPSEFSCHVFFMNSIVKRNQGKGNTFSAWSTWDINIMLDDAWKNDNDDDCINGESLF